MERVEKQRALITVRFCPLQKVISLKKWRPFSKRNGLLQTIVFPAHGLFMEGRVKICKTHLPCELLPLNAATLKRKALRSYQNRNRDKLDPHPLLAE